VVVIAVLSVVETAGVLDDILVKIAVLLVLDEYSRGDGSAVGSGNSCGT
jgi:hypothetical protein